MKQNQHANKRSGGRPPKFNEPSQAITLTLPETTLRELQHIDPDRARAIVKLAKTAMHKNGAMLPPVAIVKMAPNRGLVVIGLCDALRQIPFLHLIEVAPARYLLALDPGNDFKSLEIAINDLLDEGANCEQRERELMVQLLEHIKSLRKTDRVTMAEILFVKWPGKRQR